MKNKKDIFDLFRDNEHKLDERPDGKLWDRLEDRLDESEQPGRAPSRSGWRQWMSMAGVVLALIMVISVANMMLNNSATKQSAKAEGIKPTFELEEIGVFSDKGPNYTVGEYQKILARLNTSPIQEGDPNKKIRIQQSVFASLKEESKRQVASVEKILEAEEEVMNNPIASRKQNAKLSKEKNLRGSSRNESYDDLEDVADAKIATNVETNKDVSDSGVIGNGDGEEVAADMVVTEAAPTTSAPTAMEEELMVMEDAQLNAMKNDISVDALHAQAGIQQFEWLLGKWEAPTSTQYSDVAVTSSTSGKAKRSRSAKKEAAQKMSANASVNRSMEEWKPLDEFTIGGQGYLVINGDTTFTENMQIKKIDSDLYYILALDNSGQTKRYKLKTYTETEVVFENEAVAFPNQVILQKDVSNSNFTTVLQNKVPAQINAEQQQYFQNRNAINQEQVRRVLKRVEE